MGSTVYGRGRTSEDEVQKERDVDPHWVCYRCGKKYGNRDCGVATWHHATCGICGNHVPVTEVRDFSYLRKDWWKE